MKGLGERIRTLRKDARLTIVDLAVKTSIDQATLSRIENGKMTGTLDSHRRIAEALGIRLPDLYDSVTDPKAEAQDKKLAHKLETFSHSSGAVAELLTTAVLQKKMMPVLLKLKVKGHTESEEYSPQTERFLYVAKGQVELILGRDKESRILKQHDSLYFNAANPHQIWNRFKSESWVVSVLTPSSL
jgi:transcriptional regulator with XRE-family HTH domain